MGVLGWLNGPFSGRKPKLAQNLTFLDYQIDGVDFFGGSKAFLELIDGQLTTLRGYITIFGKCPKICTPSITDAVKSF